MPQFDAQFLTPTLFWSAVSFLFLLGILWKFALPGLTEIMESRQQRIREDLESAQKQRQDAEKLKAEHEANLKAAKAQADEVLAKAQEKAAQLLAANENRMKEEADRITADAQRAISQERAKALTDLRALAADLAVSAAGKFVAKALDEKTQLKLVDESLAELESRYRQ
ncbi:MAG: F0F1 ATP synthase subunit B [Nitrospirota bacterium]|nr:F0F1 ATP synthase subunit B [Nitrospirota bacterium]